MISNHSEISEGTGLCCQCFEKKEGTTNGPVGGHGFGSQPRPGKIAICVNPSCEVGQKNLAAKKQSA